MFHKLLERMSYQGSKNDPIVDSSRETATTIFFRPCVKGSSLKIYRI